MDALFQPFVERLAQLSFVRSATVEAEAHFDEPHRDGTLALVTPAGSCSMPFLVVESPLIRSRLQDVFDAALAHSNLIVLTQHVTPALGDLLEEREINFIDLEGNCYVTIGTRYVARRQAAERSRQGASVGSKPSELYQRYNGFMLGFWAMCLPLEAMAPRYERYRLQIHDLMVELGLSWRLPERHADYVQASEHCELLVAQLERIGSNLAEFFIFGADTLHVLVDPASDASGASFERLTTVAQRYALDRDQLEVAVGGSWSEGVPEERLYDEIVTRAYRVAGIALESCLPNPGSCYVIMPFSEPFRSYYASFYRPALTLAGYEALRAWNGVSSEAYVSLQQRVMCLSGAALADLSPVGYSMLSNGNVLHEVGLSMGLGKPTYLLRDARECTLPSNLAGLRFFEYDPTASGWPDEYTLSLAARVRELEQARDKSRA